MNKLLFCVLATSLAMLTACNNDTKDLSKTAKATETKLETEKQAPMTENFMMLENVANARDLGGFIGTNGKRIKKGVLFRSANLSKASENDVKALQNQNIKLICDLRTEHERNNAMDVEIPGAENVWFDVLGALPKGTGNGPSAKEATKIGKAMNPNTFDEESAIALVEFVKTGVFDGMMEDLYVNLPTKEDAQKQFARMFDDILGKQGGGILWHCSQGKDRAGLATVFVLAALGVDSSAIIQDFNVSNKSYETMLTIIDKVCKKMNVSEKHHEILRALIGVNDKFLKRALDYIAENFGSMENYLRQKIGLDNEKLAKLREFYLE